MDIINPFEEIVVFGKRLPLEPTSSTKIRALKPTGKHLGHGLDLTHVRGRASGGRATKLERYTTTPVGLRTGPFGKAFGTHSLRVPKVHTGADGNWGKTKTELGLGLLKGGHGRIVPTNGGLRARQVQNGLAQIRNTPKATLKPTGQSWKQPITKADHRKRNIAIGAGVGTGVANAPLGVLTGAMAHAYDQERSGNTPRSNRIAGLKGLGAAYNPKNVALIVRHSPGYGAALGGGALAGGGIAALASRKKNSNIPDGARRGGRL